MVSAELGPLELNPVLSLGRHMSKAHFDLNLLRALDALLAERNVTRAAERQFVTQQAMSGTLARLRMHFGDELLVRIGRRFELTPLGRSLVDPVREALLQAESALATQPVFDPASARRVMHIAMSDYATLVILPHFLQKMQREAPHITCHIHRLDQDSLASIIAGELDLCISAGDWSLYPGFRRSADLRTQVMFHDDFVCAVDENHPEVNDSMPLDLYRRLPHIATRLGPSIQTVVEQAWAAAQLPLHVTATAPNFSSVLFMLPGTRMVGTVQRRLCHVLASSLRLATFECPLEIKPLEEVLIWHGRQEDAPAHSFVRAALLSVARDIENRRL